MKLKKLATAAALAGALALTAVGAAAGTANADPPPWIPGPHPWDSVDYHAHWRGAPWGDGPAPWGWGPPPPPAWAGPLPAAWAPPPAPINYWGYNVQPVFDPGYSQWGFWLFGNWIPL